MSLQTYRLVVEEDETHSGLDVELRDDEGLIVETTRLTYADHGIEPAGEGGDRSGHHWEREVTTDADVIELEIDFDGSAFAVEVRGGSAAAQSAGAPDTVGQGAHDTIERVYLDADDLDLAL